MAAQDIDTVEWDSMPAQSKMRDEVPWDGLQRVQKGAGSASGETGEVKVARTGVPEDST